MSRGNIYFILLCVFFSACKSSNENKSAASNGDTPMILPVQKIVGGDIVSNFDAYPFYVGIIITDTKGVQYFCGGSLISTKHVLTAGHCVADIPPNRPDLVKVLLHGARASTQASVNVQGLYLNPSYTVDKDGNNYNDLAILELKDTYADAQPVHLAHDASLDKINDYALAIGRGLTSETGTALQNDLNQVYLPIYNYYPSSEDISLHSLNVALLETQIGAGFQHGHADTCQGDSGGPLLVGDLENLTNFTQIGITSYGYGCARSNYLGYYTRVSHYFQWICTLVTNAAERASNTSFTSCQ